MGLFRKRPQLIKIAIDAEQAQVLRNLINEVTNLIQTELGEKQATPTDAFERWAAELNSDPPVPTDPAIRQLFPNPYPDDERAAADYRRFSQDGLRDKKLSDLHAMATTLQAPIALEPEQAWPWLRGLSTLRLVLATRLGIDSATAADDIYRIGQDDPRANVFAIYQWLSELQEWLSERTLDV